MTRSRTRPSASTAIGRQTGGRVSPSRLGQAGAASRVAHLCPLRHEQERGLLVVLAVVLAAAAAVAAVRGARARRRGEPGA